MRGRMEGKEERGKVGWNVGGWNGWMDGWIPICVSISYLVIVG